MGERRRRNEEGEGEMERERGGGGGGGGGKGKGERERERIECCNAPTESTSDITQTGRRFLREGLGIHTSALQYLQADE